MINIKSNSFMKYSIKASSIAKVRLRYIRIRNYVWDYPKTADSVANPAELFLGSFAACALKMWNVFRL
jgi:hypothetical protein